MCLNVTRGVREISRASRELYEAIRMGELGMGDARTRLGVVQSRTRLGGVPIGGRRYKCKDGQKNKTRINNVQEAAAIEGSGGGAIQDR